MIGLLFVNHI